MFIYWGRTARNRKRVLAIRDESSTAVEALARLFTDERIEDAGTVPGRLRAILAATEHHLMPGLHTGTQIGLSGFREEFQDPWESSSDQAGHFLTAARFGFDSSFLNNPIYPILLGGTGDQDLPLRLMVGHEKRADPVNVDSVTPRTVVRVLKRIRAQYQSVDDGDVAHFRAGDLDAIQVGSGRGNSMADLRLSYIGWNFGRQVRAGHFLSTREIAGWIIRELGGDSDPASHVEPSEAP